MQQEVYRALRVVCFTLAVSSIAWGKAGNTTIQQKHNTMPSGQTSNQTFLIKEVRHELTMLPYYSLFDWLEFRIEDETVTLSGQVVRPTLKSDAEQVVSKIKGVEKVVNQIEVLPPSPMDNRIRLAEARAIFNFNAPLYRYGLQAVPSIHIIVKNGNVTLKGIVDNQSDSNLANIKARGVSGVFAVNNELSVEKR